MNNFNQTYKQPKKKTLSEHNKILREKAEKRLLAGVLCDKCHSEMRYEKTKNYRGRTLIGLRKRKVVCPNCGKEGELLEEH